MQNDFIKKFKHYCSNEKLVRHSDKIVVAVSGGLDSVVLLYCLMQISSQKSLQLIVAHLNHMLRKEEADSDELFVDEYATSLNSKFVSKKMSVEKYAVDNKLSIELAAREVRYQFLEQVRKEHKFDKIATAHHASDQAETVLFNFIRGSGWRGLGGMLPERDTIIRPLLFANRREIKLFAQEMNLEYVQDSSNLSMDHTRNFIRHRFLPAIKRDLNPNIHKRLVHFGHIFQEGDDYLAHEAKKAYQACLISQSDENFTLDIRHFCTYFTILQKYILFYLLEKAGFAQNVLSFSQLNQIIETIHRSNKGRWYNLPLNWKIGVDHSGIVLYKKKSLKPICIPIKIGDEVSISQFKVKFSSQIMMEDGNKFAKDPDIEFADADKLKEGEIAIRTIRDGDYFYPLGLGHKQKLSDFFINQKIAEHHRSKIMVLTCNDKIVWIVGIRLDHRYRITGKTKNRIKLKIENE